MSTMSQGDLVDLLQSALGRERAETAVHEASVALGYDAQTLTRPEALGVLGKIADLDGLVGISARFARSRLMSRWATDDLEARREESS